MEEDKKQLEKVAIFGTGDEDRKKQALKIRKVLESLHVRNIRKYLTVKLSLDQKKKIDAMKFYY